MDKNQECQEAARSFEQFSLGSACQYDPLHENWENRSSQDDRQQDRGDQK